MRKYIIGAICSIGLGFIGFCIGHLIGEKEGEEKVKTVRIAWYNACEKAEKEIAIDYARFYLLNEKITEDESDFMSIVATGEAIGTSIALEHMNNVLVSIGEPESLLCNRETILKRIENRSNDLIETGSL